jgi:hypothetical protein
MVQAILIGIGAGFASALLFAAPLSGAAIAFPLFALTGLPIALVGFGWTMIAALVATVTGAAIAAFVFSPAAGAIFALVFGLPLTWAIRFAALSRPVDEAEQEGPREWYPIGRLLLHTTLAAAIGLVLVGVIVGFDPSKLATEMVDAFAEWLATSSSTPPSREQLQGFVNFNIAAMPVTIAIILVAVLVFDLWLAAWITRRSGRLLRPPDRLWTVSIPRGAVAGFAVALVAGTFDGPLGDIGRVFAGALGCAIAMVGLAVMHALTLGNAGRGAILTVAYALLFVFGFPILLFAIVGVAESFLNFRARRFGAAPPST